MDYYQGVVLEYLRADRSLFINTEYCIQTAPGMPAKGTHWYCDALICDLRNQRVFLGETTFRTHPGTLLARLAAWNRNWSNVLAALNDHSGIPLTWPVRPWLFVPKRSLGSLVKGLALLGQPTERMFTPLITPLEMVVPWRYSSWDRGREDSKDEYEIIPVEMRT